MIDLRSSRSALILLVLLGAFISFYEFFYIMKFNTIIYSVARDLGLELKVVLATPDLQQSMAIILAVIIIAVVIIKPAKALGRLSIIYDGFIMISGILGFSYIAYIYGEVVREGYLTLTLEKLFIPLLAFIALIDASRRVVGLVLPALATLTLLLTWVYEGYNIRLILNHFYYSKEGVFGIPLFVMVSYVFAFILFGSFLSNLGVGKYITDFILASTGRRVKGVAKLAVIASLAVGTVSGSSVANVMVTGTYTIPLSKKGGYQAHVAGAAEASASTGGQLAPPILGAAAFVMAEFLGRPYRDIMIASIIPAFLYFTGVYVFIDRVSKKYGVTRVSEDLLPPLRPLLYKIYLLSPIPLITMLLLLGIEPQYAAIGSLGIVVLTAWISMEMSSILSKLLLGVLMTLILVASLYAGFSISLSFFILGVISIPLLLALPLFFHEARAVLGIIASIFKDTVVTVAPVFLAATLAGIIQGSLTLTGLAAIIGYKVLDLAGGNVFIVMAILMVISLVLGMGVPTTANYIITSTIGGAALATAISSWTGLPLESAKLAAHMFVFYFGILADVTPPVALASYAASSLAKADFWKTAITAAKFSLAGYLVPYIFVLNPSLLLVIVNWSPETLTAFLLGLGGAIMTILALSAAVEGWHGGPIPLWERIVLAVLALLNTIQEPLWLSAILLTVTMVAYIILYYMRRGWLRASQSRLPHNSRLQLFHL